jgi:hypothetical protein
LKAYPIKWFHKPGELLANLLQLPRLSGNVPLSSEAKKFIGRASQAGLGDLGTEKDRVATGILDRTYASADRAGTWPAFSAKEKTDAADLVKKVLEPLISGKEHTVSTRTETRDYMNFLISKKLSEEFRRGVNFGEPSVYRHPGGKLQVRRRIDTAGRDRSGAVITLNPTISNLTEEEAARVLTAEQVKLYDRFAQSLLEATRGKPISGSIMGALATPPPGVINELLPKFPREGYEFFISPEGVSGYRSSSSPNRQLLRHLIQIGTTPAIGAGVTGVGGYGAYRMGKQSADAYVRGFAQKCSEAGVNPQQLIELAKAN